MLNGSMVALITPMTGEGKVDYIGLEELIEFHIEQGTDAIVSVGTTGESATLTTTEHLEVVKQTVQMAAGRLPVIAGNGANATAKAVELTLALSKTGVAAMLGVTPYYNKPSQKGLVAHYKAVADCTDIPQILYNVPSRTGVDLLPETVAELSAVSNILGVKEATGDLSRVGLLRQLCRKNFKLYSGDDATACEFLLLGGDGVISVANNLAPKAFKAMCDAALNANVDSARDLNEPLTGLYTELFCEANPIPVKWAIHRMGLINHGYIRLPLTELSDAYQGQLLQAMKKAGIEVN